MKNSLSINHYLATAFLIMSTLFLTGCGDHSDHDDHKGHDHSSHEGHDHDDHKGHDHSSHEGVSDKEHDPLVVGPRGGKVLSHPEHRVELWVDDERYVHLASLDDKGVRTDLTDFSVSAIYGDRSSPGKMSFKKDAGEWKSEKALPEGKSVPFVLTTTVQDEKLIDRIDLKLWNCSGCDLMEYACTCTH